MIKLGFITDEVSQSLSDAIAFAHAFDLSAVELRSVEGEGPFAWTEEAVRGFSQTLSAHKLSVAAISAPLFKCDITDQEQVSRHIAGFRRCAQFADILGTRIIRGFDFWNCHAPVAQRASIFAPIDRICAEFGITCALEYDPSVHSSTAQELREMVDALGSPRIRAVFDPGNGVFSRPDRQPIPADYEALRGVLCHVHCKDAVPCGESAQAVCIGTGVVDYPRLFSALLQDGYDGYVMLETHYRKDKALDEVQLRLPGGAGFSDGAWAASAESMHALQRLWKEACSASSQNGMIHS